MPEDAICTENIVISALGTGIESRGARWEYPPEYFVQHLTVCLPLLFPAHLKHIVVYYLNRLESDHYNGMS
jgi:hypothetical protein